MIIQAETCFEFTRSIRSTYWYFVQRVHLCAIGHLNITFIYNTVCVFFHSIYVLSFAVHFYFRSLNSSLLLFKTKQKIYFNPILKNENTQVELRPLKPREQCVLLCWIVSRFRMVFDSFFSCAFIFQFLAIVLNGTTFM